MDESSHPIPRHPKLLVEETAEIKNFSKKDSVPLKLLQCSNLVQQQLSRMNINILSLPDKTVQVTPEVMRMQGGLLKREITGDYPERLAAIAAKERIKPSKCLHRENERDCSTVVHQLVSSIPQKYLNTTRTS